ncbi:hypothetical protein [Mesomycoplasma lagogenitalium]|uniref:Uncharacterized protein n=1 Tax=Mesomycoplasma lagogenitalium TaxID=171286 RepID=A0ABY8LTT4_9BACT|nr:hypothetical protein [Mesomycoplasma lagogenitalium]WGI36651.1 hypothetical protein QEG99_04275 [Mesomycoplasma lagogenitalium]
MKTTFSLLNLSQLTTGIVVPIHNQTREQNNDLKTIYSDILFFDAINKMDKGEGNVFKNDFVHFIKELEKEDYQNINKEMKLDIFISNDQKNTFLEIYKNNSLFYQEAEKTYMVFQSQRALFSSRQRMSISSWINILENKFLSISDEPSFSNIMGIFGLIFAGGASIVAAPFTGGTTLAMLAVGGGALGSSIGFSFWEGSRINSAKRKKEFLKLILREYRTLYDFVLESNDYQKESKIKSLFKEYAKKVNSVFPNLIDFEDFEVKTNTDLFYDYEIYGGY